MACRNRQIFRHLLDRLLERVRDETHSVVEKSNDDKFNPIPLLQDIDDEDDAKQDENEARSIDRRLGPSFVRHSALPESSQGDLHHKVYVPVRLVRHVDATGGKP